MRRRCVWGYSREKGFRRMGGKAFRGKRRPNFQKAKFMSYTSVHVGGEKKLDKNLERCMRGQEEEVRRIRGTIVHWSKILSLDALHHGETKKSRWSGEVNASGKGEKK